MFYSKIFENIYENCLITVVKLVKISYNNIYIGYDMKGGYT